MGEDKLGEQFTKIHAPTGTLEKSTRKQDSNGAGPRSPALGVLQSQKKSRSRAGRG